jgi:hypothetical protein
MSTADPMTTSFTARTQPAPAPPPPSAGGARVVEELPAITAPVPTTSIQTVETEPVVTVAEYVPAKAKTHRLNIDSIFVLILAVGIVFLLMTASFIASFAAIYDIAEFTGTPEELRWVFPVYIDLAILGYTIALFIFKRRGTGTARTIAGLVGFALLSVAANVGHTLVYWDGDLSDYRAWIGVALTASAPIAVLLASEEIARLAFSNPDEE